MKKYYLFFIIIVMTTTMFIGCDLGISSSKKPNYGYDMGDHWKYSANGNIQELIDSISEHEFDKFYNNETDEMRYICSICYYEEIIKNYNKGFEERDYVYCEPSNNNEQDIIIKNYFCVKDTLNTLRSQIAMYQWDIYYYSTWNDDIQSNSKRIGCASFLKINIRDVNIIDKNYNSYDVPEEADPTAINIWCSKSDNLKKIPGGSSDEKFYIMVSCVQFKGYVAFLPSGECIISDVIIADSGELPADELPTDE